MDSYNTGDPSDAYNLRYPCDSYDSYVSSASNDSYDPYGAYDPYDPYCSYDFGDVSEPSQVASNLAEIAIEFERNSSLKSISNFSAVINHERVSFMIGDV